MFEPPPPPYAANTNQTTYLNPNEKEKSSSSTSEPSLSRPTTPQPGSRTLNVCFKGWKSSGIRILAADNTTELYSNKCSLRKPQMTFTSTATGAVVGTATFHLTSWSVDTTIHESPVKLTAHGLSKSRYTYQSPALGGREMTWKIKSHMFNYDLVCLDAGGVEVAKFHFSNCSFKKMGRMEVMGPIAGDEAVVEEVLVTGLTLAEALLAIIAIH